MNPLLQTRQALESYKHRVLAGVRTSTADLTVPMSCGEEKKVTSNVLPGAASPHPQQHLSVLQDAARSRQRQIVAKQSRRSFQNLLLCACQGRSGTSCTQHCRIHVSWRPDLGASHP